MPVLNICQCISWSWICKTCTISLLAGIDLLTGTVHYKIFDRHRSVEFIEFLKILDSNYPKHIKIVIILDNVRVHTSKKTLEYLKTVPQRFHFVFTPKHASWLNIIESLFSKWHEAFSGGFECPPKRNWKRGLANTLTKWMKLQRYLSEIQNG